MSGSGDQRAADERYMAAALEEAEAAFRGGEVPVGAVLVDGEGRVLCRTRNETVGRNDPTAHAEILALREGAAAVGNYRLTGCTLFVTVEPCAMCAGAMVWARIRRLVYGARDPKAGAAGSLWMIVSDGRLNHRVEVLGGVMERESRETMQRFFRARR